MIRYKILLLFFSKTGKYYEIVFETPTYPTYLHAVPCLHHHRFLLLQAPTDDMMYLNNPLSVCLHSIYSDTDLRRRSSSTKSVTVLLACSFSPPAPPVAVVIVAVGAEIKAAS